MQNKDDEKEVIPQNEVQPQDSEIKSKPRLMLKRTGRAKADAAAEVEAVAEVEAAAGADAAAEPEKPAKRVREPKAPKETLTPKPAKEPKPPREPKPHKAPKPPKPPKAPKPPRPPKPPKPPREPKPPKPPKPPREPKPPKPPKAPKPPIDFNELRNAIFALSFTIVAAMALTIVRSSLFYYESYDYIASLSRWVTQYQQVTFFEGLSTKIGNYNQPYMYILNIIARIDFSVLYQIKIVSVFFDLLLAFFVMKLVSLKSKSINMQILAFFTTFAIPTVVLNSAMWGQCDSIYTAFVVGAIYFALKERSKATYVFIALAVSFKLQAAFVLPLFVIFAMQKKIKWYDCYIFFLTYIAMLLPAYLAGYPLNELLLVYLKQTDSYHFLKLNALNIWQFVENVEFEHFRTVGLYMAGVAALGLMYFAYVNRERLKENVDYIRFAYLFAVVLPFLLPQMHDRFFYMADVLALVLFLFDKRRWYVPVITVFCSFLAYVWFLMDYIYIFDYKIAVLALTGIIFVVLRDLVISLTQNKETKA